VRVSVWGGNDPGSGEEVEDAPEDGPGGAANAISPVRKTQARSSPKLGPVREFIDGILQSDLEAPRRQRADVKSSPSINSATLSQPL
jgi:hypothetical protein